MNRFSMQPISYASIDDLRRALLIQIRRFNKACAELATQPPARVVNLGSPLSEKTVTVTKSRISPDLEKLDLLRAQILLLNSMSGQLMTQFGTEEKSKDLRKQVDELRNEILAKMNTLQRTISTEAKDNVDNLVKKRARDLQQELIKDYDLQPSQVPAQFYVSEICINSMTPNVAAEVFVIRIVDLEDSEHNRQPNFFVTVAFPKEFLVSLKDGKAQKFDSKKLSPMYVAVSPQFRIPSKVQWDQAVKSTQDLQRVVKLLLERDNIVGVSEKREIPIPVDKLVFDHANMLGKHSVKGNTIEIHISNKDKIEPTARSLITQLNNQIRALNPRNRDLIKYSVDDNRGIVRIVFAPPGKMKGRSLSPTLVNDLKTKYHLTDMEIKRLNSAMEDHEQE